MLSKIELKRQIMHIVIGLSLVVLYYFDIINAWMVFLGIVIGVLASFICKRYPLPLFTWFIKHLERDEEKKRFPGKGLIFYFVGVLLVMQLFDKDIALAAIMILALGDSISHIFGAEFGMIKNFFNGNKKKLFEGTVMGMLAAFVGALVFVPFTEALLGAFAAMAAEVIQVDLNHSTVDDNMIVPLVAGTAILLVRTFL